MDITTDVVLSHNLHSKFILRSLTLEDYFNNTFYKYVCPQSYRSKNSTKIVQNILVQLKKKLFF